MQQFLGFATLANMRELEEVLERGRSLIIKQDLTPNHATKRIIDEVSERSNAPIDEDLLNQKALLELTGLGVLQPYLDDPQIEEIAINRPNEIQLWTSTGHKSIQLDLSAAAIRNITLRMLSYSGRRVDRLTPFVDASIKDGSRLHVVIPEITQEHWSINIRKFRKSKITLKDLQAAGALTDSQFEILQRAMKSQKSILIAGATQAGKTTLMTALLNELSDSERLVSCEDTFEISVSHSDWVAMQTRPAGSEGAREITLRELVKQSLRMRPTRLVIGEVRGAEALDMLVALNSGIPGLCTIHANSAQAAIRKLLTLPLLAGDNITESFLKPTIVGAFDLVLFCEKDKRGIRRVTEVLEVPSDFFE
ncbi:MAG: Flp pilus assembly complex ATPase component TadA [Aquiluna sp.]|nr:Flp pilus assembly complex ATPase component TadA [Aquiluna sp.]MCF8545321.1 Flp pilus assembly complex ATPase component TadA [Aquiluna sp.]